MKGGLISIAGAILLHAAFTGNLNTESRLLIGVPGAAFLGGGMVSALFSKD